MCQAMQKLMEDNDFWDKCSNNSLSAVKEQFNIENVLQKTLSLYENVKKGAINV